MFHDVCNYKITSTFAAFGVFVQFKQMHAFLSSLQIDTRLQLMLGSGFPSTMFFHLLMEAPTLCA